MFYTCSREWRTLMTKVSNEVSQCSLQRTHTMISAAKSALQRCMPTLIGEAGMETVLLAEEKLRKRANSESVSPSVRSTTTDSTGLSSSTSAERSSVDQSDGICNTVEDFLREVMEKSICKVASSKKAPLSGNWKMTSSLLAEEILETSSSNLFAGLESREDLQTTTPKAVEKLKERADHSSQTPEYLVVQPIHSVTSRETTANHVSQRDDLTISTNDVSDEVKYLHHPTASCAVWNIPTLNTGSAMLIWSPRWTVSPIFQLHFDSCMDT
ncbi:hypothetical protein AOLI_G00137770 [Acnodon oligacanthus]